MVLEEWSIVFYVDSRGRTPAIEFLRALDIRTQARFDWSIEQLRVRNTQAREPLARHLEGKIWELRRESNTRIYRLLYCFLSGRRILILHGFQKKVRRTPPQEIATAQQRLDDFLARGGGE